MKKDETEKWRFMHCGAFKGKQLVGVVSGKNKLEIAAKGRVLGVTLGSHYFSTLNKNKGESYC